MTALCPKCGKPITRVNVTAAPIHTPVGQVFEGLAYSCPECNVVLSIAHDPVYIGSEIVQKIVAATKTK